MTRPDVGDIVAALREVYGVAQGDIPLHAPVFGGHEKQYVEDTIESTFVSTVGAYVSRFEDMLKERTGAAVAVAMVNGTTALQIALQLAGVKQGDLVITQSLSFVATANAVRHLGAEPAFVDVEHETLGLCPRALRRFLESECAMQDGAPMHKPTGRRLAACVPMHSFGMPCSLMEIMQVCEEWSIPLVEDAAEALGSMYQGKPCGTFGLVSSLSFNGNKIVTCGGGGAILTNDIELGRRAKHLTTTAKLPHRWRFTHDEVGFNYRMPNINAALGCAQLERLDEFIAYKRDLADRYRRRFSDMGIAFQNEPANSKSIFWLCAILMKDAAERDALLEASNNAGVMTRPIWDPLHQLPMYSKSPRGDMSVTLDIASRLVNIPSGFREKNPATAP
jgi:perosamine synthetase